MMLLIGVGTLRVLFLKCSLFCQMLLKIHSLLSLRCITGFASLLPWQQCVPLEIEDVHTTMSLIGK